MQQRWIYAFSALVFAGSLMSWACGKSLAPYPTDFEAALREALSRQSISISQSQAKLISAQAKDAVVLACRYPQGNSKIGFTAIEMASALDLNPALDATLKERLTAAIKSLADDNRYCALRESFVERSWEEYYNRTIGLNQNSEFLSLVGENQFSPVKISWEDIGRYENSVWGDRISDVGIWVRKRESDPHSAELALSVRRDNNFRDKILMVPADKIKIHTKTGGRTVEVSLPERLRQLGLASKTRDRHVIVSNQFAIVPVPSPAMKGVSKSGKPPRAAFNFSIFPYGSTNFVITDVIEGSSNAIVGPGNHQLLFADINGKKAPFTASRAEDRQDLLKLEATLKEQGMDVDVQRYYLIQIPLRRDAGEIELSNMGTPPMRQFYPCEMEENSLFDGAVSSPSPMATTRQKAEAGLGKVAIGHGEAEGAYHTGKGYRNMRAEEPIRVTVVYFVTPKGDITRKDMETFSRAFETWDKQAIWGGSFVVKDDVSTN